MSRSRRWLHLLAVFALSTSGVPASAGTARASLEVRVGQAKIFSRIELRGAVPRAIRRQGDVVVLVFSGARAPDIARLHVDPPPYLKSAELDHGRDGIELRLTPVAGAVIRTGSADGATWVNLAPRPIEPATASPASKTVVTAAPTVAPDPIRASPPVRMQAKVAGGELQLRFPWRSPPAAAVFQRGETVWIVFDANAKLDLAAAPHSLGQARRFTAVEGPGWTGVKFAAPPGARLRADVDGPAWLVSLAPPGVGPSPPSGVGVERDPSGLGLRVRMAGSTGVFQLRDTDIGDRLVVVTALAPAKGLSQPRDFIDVSLLRSAQGLALQPKVDDLAVNADGDLVHIDLARGLALSSSIAVAPAHVQAAADLPHASRLPGLIDFADWSRTGARGFVGRYQELQDRAATEGGAGKDAPLVARMGLARFLVGSELAPEAIGVLNSLFKHDARLGDDAQFRALRGAARVLAGRWKEAEADLSTPAVAADPASALWRGYARVQTGDFAGARPQFALGLPSLPLFAPKWRARFARADAEAALAVGDAPAAAQALSLAQPDGSDPEGVAGWRLVQARLLEAQGQTDRALALYGDCAMTAYGAVAAPATLAATRIRLAQGKIASSEAADLLDSLRFRWRGDATEIEVIRELAAIDLSQGRYREALEALRSSGASSPDTAASAGLRSDLSDTFKALFLHGRADGLEPVQALALFYDFKELTPIGADGDLMVRLLVKRLVDADLLDQAATLLKYQVDNRLDGVAKGEVATDLAAIQLMAGRPESALAAINASRTTLLPMPLNRQRHLIEARALTALGRYDQALELIGADTSPDALEAKGLVAWRNHAWPQAARLAEARLGERWRSSNPLTAAESALLVRAGSAYSLAQDDASLTRLRGRYGKLAETAPQAAALRVALLGMTSDGADASDLTRVMADADRLSSWVMRMKSKLGEVEGPPRARADVDGYAGEVGGGGPVQPRSPRAIERRRRSSPTCGGDQHERPAGDHREPADGRDRAEPSRVG